MANFQMGELSETAVVNHKFNVHDSPPGQCDVIIGRDLSSHTGLDVCGSDQTMKWPSKMAEAPFKNSGLNKEETHHVKDPASPEGETDRMSRILDAKHSEADSCQVAKEAKTLNGKEQKQLEKVLKANETSFDGTLGRWKGNPHELKSKENVQPHHAKPFSVPMLMKKL